jgi:hypothetical protein
MILAEYVALLVFVCQGLTGVTEPPCVNDESQKTANERCRALWARHYCGWGLTGQHGTARAPLSFITRLSQMRKISRHAFRGHHR